MPDTRNKRTKTPLFLLLSLILATTACKDDSPKFARNKETEKLIGSRFNSLDLIDTTVKAAQIDFSKSEFTMVDFWFSTCPTCLSEMKEFDQLLNGKNKRLQIASISINGYGHWKTLFHSKDPVYSFLRTKNPLWTHYALKSKEDPRLRNEIPSDNLQFMENTFHARSYPVYFVVNREGDIIEVPTSAVAYIRNALK